MPRTHFPNGVSARTLSATPAAVGTGDIACVDAFVAGTVSAAVIVANTLSASQLVATNITLSTANTMVGERFYIPFTFTSAASTTYYASPQGGRFLDVFVTADTTPRTVSGLTIRQGTAGTVFVATDSTLVFDTAIGQQMQPTVTAAAVNTASSLAVIVTTAGTAANFAGTMVIVISA